MNEIHTWVYKRISSLTNEEIEHEIDCVIKNRKLQWFMHVTEQEYVKKIMKLYADSSSVISTEDAINRYYSAIYENNKIINLLEYAKKEHDYSVITGKNGFDTSKYDGYIFIAFDEPFHCKKQSSFIFYNKDIILSYLENIEQPELIEYISNNKKEYGLTKELIENINDFFEKHGENNLIIEII